MDRKYIVINSNASWAQELNMRLSPKHKMKVINPWKLKKDLKNAVEEFLKDAEKDKNMLLKLRKIYKKLPLEWQVMKTSKFEYIKENN